MKKLKQLAFFTLALVVIFGGCQKDEYKEVVGVCPVVVSTVPTDKAVNVPLNQVVTATFNEKMNPETITDESFTLHQGETKIAGANSYNNVTASLDPSSPLLPFTLYTGRVTTSAKDPMGNALQEDYVWTFTTIPEVVLSSLPIAGGTTSGAGTFNQGSLVTVIATPNDGYSFVNWTENGTVVSTNPSYQFTMAGNKAFVANFSQQYVVSLSSNPVLGGTTSGSGVYDTGTDVTATAIPNAQYNFVNWTEGTTIVSTDAIYLFQLNASRTLVANFALKTYTLNVEAVNGTVVKNPNLTDYNSGAVVELTATPNEGFTFTGWTGDATGSLNPLSVTMNSNKNITANFTATVNTYTLNVQAVNGTVVKVPNQTNYNSGAIVVLTATANEGFTFTGWTGDATGSLNPLSVTMNSNKNITANFTATVNTYTLNVQAVNGSVVKVPNLTDYNSGAIVVLTATANEGFTFTGWTGDATGSLNPLSVTMNSNKNITANFTATVNTYTLNVQAVNGVVVKNPDLTDYNSGAIVELTATPDDGFTFTGWTGDATGSLNPLSVTMNSNKNITANFTATVNTYTLNVQAVNGSVVKNPDLLDYNSGAIVELTATPDNGFEFDSWSGDASGNLPTATVTMDANKNVTANFIALPPTGPGTIDLGGAGNFSILTMSGISSTGVTAVGGDIGVSPAAAAAITGFGLIMDTNGQSSHTAIATHVTGKVYASDYAPPTPSNLTVAVADMLTAYTTANNLVTPAPVLEKGAGNLSGLTLAPGLYKWETEVLIADGASVTLSGGANDTWVFQIAQDLTLNSSAQVNLIGGAQAKNITWVVAGQAVLGTNTVLYGNILSKTLISLNTGAKVTGKLLAQTAVTLNASTVVEP